MIHMFSPLWSAAVAVRVCATDVASENWIHSRATGAARKKKLWMNEWMTAVISWGLFESWETKALANSYKIDKTEKIDYKMVNFDAF